MFGVVFDYEQGLQYGVDYEQDWLFKILGVGLGQECIQVGNDCQVKDKICS